MAMRQDLATSPDGDADVFFDSGETLIRLVGEIDLALAEDLDLAARQTVERGSPVRVELSGVTFLDSTGLSLIARLVAAERKAGRKPQVEGASRRVAELLEVAGLRPLVDLARADAT